MPGRFRSEAAFAALAGINPIPASSGPVTRYRLNRGGDRRARITATSPTRDRAEVTGQRRRRLADRSL